jgi:dipeptidase E
MRLYLSSFRVGSYPQRLLQLVGAGRRVALIPNALDGVPEQARRPSLEHDSEELRALGLDVTQVDLCTSGAAGELASYDLIWVRGGNTFVLRRVFADSGADEVLTALLRDDALVYGGYSAGVCVLTPDLSDLRHVDDISVVSAPITTGLGLLDRPFVPHVASPGHPETTACDEVSADLRRHGRDHWALSDGDVLVVDGQRTQLLRGDTEPDGPRSASSAT